MSKRNYSKRTKSTNRKTYTDYMAFREEQLSKGIQLKDAMSEVEFNAVYSQVAKAKKAGQIKSSPWQYLKSKERLLSSKQAKIFKMAVNQMNKDNGLENKIKLSDVYKLNISDIHLIGEYINANKQPGIFGGDYE